MNDAVYERRDTHYHRHFSTLFKMAAFVLLYSQTSLSYLFFLQLQQVVQLIMLLFLLMHPVEKPKEE